jgi:nitrate reductase molybdenum cofactor assembly chaperone NarJ/NarW
MIGKIKSAYDGTFDSICEMEPRSAKNDIFKALSILLQFPDEELLGHVPQLQDVVRTFSNATTRAACNDFLAYLESTPVLRLQETYTATFDLNPQTCLNLSYHKCGNSQERGLALVKLNQLYNSAGLEISEGHLPDYLPLMLEFVYQRPLEGTNQLLKQYSSEIEVVAERLGARESPYAPLLGLVSNLARETFGRTGD